MRNYWTTVLCFLLLLPVWLGTAAAQSKLPITDFTLANGLRVLVIEDHRAPVVLHTIGYNVGGADEVDGKTGLAHFLEHLLFRGTKRFPAGQFEALMDENGVEKNAFTTHDITAYYERGSKDLLPLFMDLEADRMKNLVLDAAIFETERKVVQEERRQRIESNPSGLAIEDMSAELFGAHPYARPVIGTPEDVASVTVEDVIAFYRNYYQPDDATVLVVGDVTPAEVRALAEKYYGVLANDSGRTAPPVRAAPDLAAPKKLSRVDPRFGSAMLVRRYIAPGIGVVTPKESAALDVLGMVLSGHPDAILEKDLVQGQGLATWAAAGYQSLADTYGQFLVYAAPTPALDLAGLEREVDAILEKIARDGIKEDALTLPKELARASFIYSSDNLAGVGSNLAMGVVLGAKLEDLLQVDKMIAEVTAADVSAAAAKVLGSSAHVTLYLDVK